MSAAKKPKPIPKGTLNAGPMRGLPKATETLKSFHPRDGLGIFIDSPETNPEGRVVEYDDDFVVINDKYPKASVHMLLLPRNPVYHTQHPLRALSDLDFLATIRPRVERLKRLAASELRRKYGSDSASDAPYQNTLDDLMSSESTSEDEAGRAALLPPGRDWLSEILAGVHTHPSMNHMHVHILSREMQSPFLKHKKHYLSFQTSFLVQMDDFPLEEESIRFRPADWPNWDMLCWRCGKNFKNKFKALKEHLEDEFTEWKVE